MVIVRRERVYYHILTIPSLLVGPQVPRPRGIACRVQMIVRLTFRGRVVVQTLTPGDGMKAARARLA